MSMRLLTRTSARCARLRRSFRLRRRRIGGRRHRRARLRERVVHDRLELVVRTRTLDNLATDDEARRRTDVLLLRQLLVCLDLRLILLAVHALVELLLIQPELPRHPLEDRIGVVRRLAIPLILRLEESVVHLPELPLLVRARRGARSRPRIAMHRKWEVDPPEANDPLVHQAAAHVRLRERGEARTRGTLEVAVLDHLDR